MSDELERVNREVSWLIAAEIEKGIKRAIVNISGESVARELELALSRVERYRNELGICQEALRDLAQETGTPYARIAREALSKVEYQSSSTSPAGDSKDG